MKKFIVFCVLITSIVLGSVFSTGLLTANELAIRPHGISHIAENQPPNPLGSALI